MKPQIQKPSGAFIAASWAALVLGMSSFSIGLWNSNMPLNEQGYYFTVLLYGFFAAVSLQKSVRDGADGIPVTGLYYALCWASVAACLLLLAIGLWNAKLADSEKGFYAMSFFLGLFGAISVKKMCVILLHSKMSHRQQQQ